MTKLEMNLTDHYPRKKRRLCLHSKTPTRPPKKVLKTPNGTLMKDITLPIKTQNIVSPVIAGSSDESSLEIGWDNNSPSPTATLRSGKIRKANKKDITALLKGLSRKKRPLEANENVINENSLTTWMQNNLAVSKNDKNDSRRSSVTRRSVKRNHQKQGASTFNEELKKFMETVMPNGKKQVEELPTASKRSPLSTTSENSKISPPSVFESTQNDSLMLVDPFDDLALEQLGMSIFDEHQKSNTLLTKTPKLRRNLHQGTTPDSENIFMKKSLSRKKESVKKKQLKLSACKRQCLDVDTGGVISGRPLPSIDTVENNDKHKKLGTSIDLDDDLDDILLTQDIIPPKQKKSDDNNANNLKSVETVEATDALSANGNDNTCFTKIKISKAEIEFANKQKIFSTPKLKNSTISFDDDLEIDDLVFNLEEEFRCRSQETPPSNFSEEQRKLKKRCHTSPFPVSRKQIIKKKTEELVENELLEDNEVILNLNAPLAEPLKKDEPQKCNAKSTFIHESLATKASRRPFKPPFLKDRKGSTASVENRNSNVTITSNDTYQSSNKINTNSSQHLRPLGMNLLKRSPLNISVISKPSHNETLSQVKSKCSAPFSSTQKCSMEEIEKKRKEAQLRLKERLRKKK